MGFLIAETITGPSAAHPWSSWKKRVATAIMEQAVRRAPTEAEKDEPGRSPYNRKTFFRTTGLLRIGIGTMRFESRNALAETSENRFEGRISEVIEALRREAVDLSGFRKEHEERAVGGGAAQAFVVAARKGEGLARRQDLEKMAEQW